MPTAAAIYARISQDRTGEALGVQRQIADCQAEAERRGWPVAEVYVDDDLSAWNGKPRPAYARLLADVRDGLRDAVVVYHLDRLHRAPRELEEFVAVCEQAGVAHVATVQGDVHLRNGDGLLVARLLAAVAANESDAKSRRVRRKMRELAEHGRPHGGGTRSFGYEPDGVTVRESEAAVIRELAGRLLAGESLSSLCRWLNDTGVPTVRGKEWRTTTLRQMLRSARISGQREHQGEIVGPGAWPAIITSTQTARIRALLDDPARRSNRTARRYLLTGLLRCHACGQTLVAHPRGGVRRYGCKRSADQPGCGKTYVTAAPVEELIAEAVLYRLDSPDLAAALEGRAEADERAAALHDDIAADADQLEELAGMYAARDITAREWKAARDPIEARRKQAERELARLTGGSVLDGYLGNSDLLRERWASLNLDRQRAIVAALVDHAVIGPGRPGAFDLNRVDPQWKHSG
jgi:DNA invertase Pin-like site-specific DNA recombinase